MSHATVLFLRERGATTFQSASLDASNAWSSSSVVEEGASTEASGSASTTAFPLAAFFAVCGRDGVAGFFAAFFSGTGCARAGDGGERCA